MIATKRRLIVVGVLTLVVGIIVLFPARAAYHWFAPPGVSVSGIAGTLWSGTALDAVAGGVYIRNLSWRIKPLRLLTGRIAYSVTAAPGAGRLRADVAASLGGTLIAEALDADLSLALFQQATGIRGLQGRARLQFDVLRVSDGTLVAADGTVDASGLLVPIIAQTGIGGYRAEFTTVEDTVIASVEDTDGVVDLAGTLTLSQDRSYLFDGVLASKDSTPPRLTQQMKFLGSANERGQYDVRLEGQL